MRRYLIVAHRTLGGDHLFDHLRHLRADDPHCRFHVLVPRYHPTDHPWDEGRVEVAAREALDETLERMASMGFGATGSVGDAKPVMAVDDCVRAEVDDPFCAMVVSTFPEARSPWWKAEVPDQLAKRYPAVPVVHLVAEDTLVS